MRLSINRDAFAELLAPTSRIAARNSVPYLSCVLIEAKGGSVSVTATDQNESMEVSAAALVEETGRALVPASRLHASVKSMPPGSVELSCGPVSAELSSKSISVKMPVLDPDDFPMFPDVKPERSVSVDAYEIRKAASACQRFASKNPDRPIYGCAHIALGEGVVFWEATDTYHIVRVGCTRAGKGAGYEAVPMSLLAGVAADDPSGKVEMSFSETMAKAAYGDTVRVIRKVEGQYPNADMFFGFESEAKALVDRSALKSAVSRSIASCSGNRSLGIFVNDDGTIELTRDGDDAESFREVVEARAVERSGNVRVSPNYLHDALEAMDAGDVELVLQGALKPVGIVSEGATAVVMPVRS